MIDQFCIFERGGTVLWHRTYEAIKGDPVAVLVRSVLLEDRLSQTELSVENYTLKWSLDNLRGLVFVVIFQRHLPPAYANDLLQLVCDHFVRVEVPDAASFDPSADFDRFSETFDRLLDTAERRTPNLGVPGLVSRRTEASVNVAKSANTASTRRKKPKKHTESEVQAKQNGHVSAQHEPDSDEANLSPEEIRRNREVFIKRRATRGAKNGSHKTSMDAATRMQSKLGSTDTVSKQHKKIMRPSNKSLQMDPNALDFSEGKPNDDSIAEDEARKFKEQFLNGERNSAFDPIFNSDDETELPVNNREDSEDYDDETEEEDDNDDDDEISDEKQSAEDIRKVSATGGLFNYFKGLAGLRSLTRADLKPVMDKFRDGLVSKNVAKDIADKLMESVFTSLEGKTMESMTSVSTMVRKALEEALTRILTPRQSTDILAEIEAKKGTGRPFVIAYCGVNGVGKSTSLAKTCFYLLNHGYKVMIAACDTFRAGAVEQLRTHVKCLGRGVELFDRGYGKDAASVAADAIRRAKELHFDVVLVDTAGRMQDNEPLMRALAKLVQVNRPDRLFFVGEALVGNDAVDQLTKFNAALTDHQSGMNPRLIDGIVLTKFDTIDDKVGAAVSMVYTTGQPIVFVGIGQTYMDLRKLNTKSLVKALLKA